MPAIDTESVGLLKRSIPRARRAALLTSRYQMKTCTR